MQQSGVRKIDPDVSERYERIDLMESELNK